jgi:hypothetical protein
MQYLSLRRVFNVNAFHLYNGGEAERGQNYVKGTG